MAERQWVLQNQTIVVVYSSTVDTTPTPVHNLTMSGGTLYRTLGTRHKMLTLLRFA